MEVNKRRKASGKPEIGAVQDLVYMEETFNDLVLPGRQIGRLDNEEEQEMATSNVLKLYPTLKELANAVESRTNMISDEKQVRIFLYYLYSRCLYNFSSISVQKEAARTKCAVFKTNLQIEFKSRVAMPAFALAKSSKSRKITESLPLSLLQKLKSVSQNMSDFFVFLTFHNVYIVF